MTDISEDGEKVGEFDIVDDSFVWTYDGDNPEVVSVLKYADEQTYGKHVDDEDPTVVATVTAEAPPEVKWATAYKGLTFTDNVELE